MLMINNHFARFQLPGNLLKTKKNVLPIYVATRNFLFIFVNAMFDAKTDDAQTVFLDLEYVSNKYAEIMGYDRSVHLKNILF
jgi:hypothetical protein